MRNDIIDNFINVAILAVKTCRMQHDKSKNYREIIF